MFHGGVVPEGVSFVDEVESPRGGDGFADRVIGRQQRPFPFARIVIRRARQLVDRQINKIRGRFAANSGRKEFNMIAALAPCANDLLNVHRTALAAKNGNSGIGADICNSHQIAPAVRRAVAEAWSRLSAKMSR